MEKKNYNLEMIKGYDKNNLPFTAFVICTTSEKNEILKKNKRINLTKLNIIHKINSHSINQKTIDYIIEYIEQNSFYKI